ncbi:MAG: GNAT family N-acetyltransferase [Bacteroidales bacterium]|nr:GNAT family N-acetyltransferase [Bacteroidales bacterium]
MTDASFFAVDKLPSGDVVRLRPVLPGDCDLLLDWQREPGARTFTRCTAVPSVDEHRSWFWKRLSDGGGLFAIIVNNDEDVGVLRFDEWRDGSLEITILISAASRGKGIGAASLRLGVKHARGRRIVANVLSANEASKRAFLSVGFTQDGEWFYFEEE